MAARSLGPRCQYDLRSFTGERCPECGERIRILPVQPRLGAFVVGLVGLLVLVLSYPFLGPLSFVRMSGISPGVIAFLVAAWSCNVVCLVVWIRRRRWLARQGLAVRWGWVLVAWLLIPVNTVALLAAITVSDIGLW